MNRVALAHPYSKFIDSGFGSNNLDESGGFGSSLFKVHGLQAMSTSYKAEVEK